MKYFATCSIINKDCKYYKELSYTDSEEVLNDVSLYCIYFCSRFKKTDLYSSVRKDL